MKQEKLIVLCLLIALLGCSKSKTEFEKSFEKLNQLSLPITFSSNRDFDMRGIATDSISIRAIPYARLFQSDNVLVRMDISSPVLHIIPTIGTYDKFGNSIDSFDCFRSPHGDIGGETIENCTISLDHTIVFVDSTITYELDTVAYLRVQGSRELKVTTEKFKIMATGKIQKIE